MSHSSRCVADTVVAFLFISLMTNDFESIFHGCKIDLLSQKSGERLNWSGMSESKGEEYNLEEDTMETRYGYESTQIPSGLLIVIFFILSLIIANG